jgi:hypothetical protein
MLGLMVVTVYRWDASRRINGRLKAFGKKPDPWVLWASTDNMARVGW